MRDSAFFARCVALGRPMVLREASSNDTGPAIPSLRIRCNKSGNELCVGWVAPCLGGNPADGGSMDPEDAGDIGPSATGGEHPENLGPLVCQELRTPSAL